MKVTIKEPEKSKGVPIIEPEQEVDGEKQIIFHCRFDSQGTNDEWIQIWKRHF